MSKPLKKLVIKVFNPHNRQAKTHQITADNGRIFVAPEVILNRFADQVEKLWPEDEYKIVDVGRGRWNFVWVGPRKPEQEAA